jgi:hypothetical protein
MRELSRNDLRLADEAHSLSYVTNRQPAKQPGETRRCKGYF